MTLEEIREAKAELQKNLVDAMRPLLNEFIAESGVEVRGITCNFIDVTSFSDPKRRLILGGVIVNLEDI
jgi:hypothetical protein